MAATDTEVDEDASGATASSKMPLLIGLVLALLLGGGGFFAVYSGLIPIGGKEESAPEKEEEEAKPKKSYSFVALEPMVVSLGSPGNLRHLQFRAEVEVTPGREAEVAAVMPRLLDTLNGFLRAVPIEELEEPSVLVILRAQMLRRLQLIGPEGSIKDLLVIEFVLD